MMDRTMLTPRLARSTRRGAAALLVTLAIAVGACGAPHHASFANTAGTYPRSTRSAPQIEILMRGMDPPVGARDCGLIDTKVTLAFGGGDQSLADAIATLREEAARQGLDGIRDLYCGAPGTVGYGDCAGIGYVYAR
ncbi:MAG: hypothetical protein IT373_11415 [Polyangiaceae bacterium]|nr:hypothetical protein [Polyangiaceae bacterium]